MKSSVSTRSPWIRSTPSKARACLRLFCFPHSGGGASFYRRWGDSIGEDIDVCPVQLPGRENRRSEPPFTQYTPLIETLADAFTPYMDMPFALFGHSLGALLSFGLARELRRRGKPGPVHLFVSGRQAPHIPRQERSIAALPDEEFLKEIRRFHGTADEILLNAELMELFFPLLRADFSIYESFVYASEPALDCSITAFGGSEDSEVSVASLMAWREHTARAFELHQFPGGHFFLLDVETQLLQIINHELAQFLDAA